MKRQYALENVVDGRSETTVSAPLEELQDEPYAINVHRSGADLKTYVACGDVGKGRGTGESDGEG